MRHWLKWVTIEGTEPKRRKQITSARNLRLRFVVRRDNEIKIESIRLSSAISRR